MSEERAQRNRRIRLLIFVLRQQAKTLLLLADRIQSLVDASDEDTKGGAG